MKHKGRESRDASIASLQVNSIVVVLLCILPTLIVFKLVVLLGKLLCATNDARQSLVIQALLFVIELLARVIFLVDVGKVFFDVVE